MAQEHITKALEKKQMPLTTIELVEMTNMNLCQVNKQAKQLTKFGFLGCRKVGLQTIWWVKQGDEQ